MTTVCGGHVCAEACGESVFPINKKNKGNSVCGKGVLVVVCCGPACAKAGGECE